MLKITMNDSHISNISQLKEAIKPFQSFDITLENDSIEAKYDFINEYVRKFKYKTLNRKEKRVFLRFIRKVTGYKHAQLHRLIQRSIRGELKHKKYVRKKKVRKYTSADVKRLERTDELHRRLSPPATKKILQRESQLFHNKSYDNLQKISPSHIANLRKHPIYVSKWLNHTKARQLDIGETRKPDNPGIPGYLRIDTVHQRDLYHINAVDETVQWEVVVTVPTISERYMQFVIYEILDQTPFVVHEIHSDRGGEFISRLFESTLSKFDIDLSKSRARKSNDNALVESKNASVVRKMYGFAHANQDAADRINAFNRQFFNIYLNYHRPCAFPLHETDDNGKETIKYRYEDYEVPYEKLKQISKEKHTNFLKPDISFKNLDIIAYKMSDNEFAALMREEQRKLYNLI